MCESRRLSLLQKKGLENGAGASEQGFRALRPSHPTWNGYAAASSSERPPTLKKSFDQKIVAGMHPKHVA
jgi:hypothetical protein